MVALLPEFRVLDTQSFWIDRGARTESEGLGDTQLLFTMGVYNLPPLTEAEYAAYQPGLGIGALARVTLPTGEYDASQSANLGANRYSFQLGSPITFAFGNSFLDPKLTTLDLLPSVTFYGTNDDRSMVIAWFPKTPQASAAL